MIMWLYCYIPRYFGTSLLLAHMKKMNTFVFILTFVRRADDFHAYCGLFSADQEFENVHSVYEIGIMYIGGLYGYTPLGTV